MLFFFFFFAGKLSTFLFGIVEERFFNDVYILIPVNMLPYVVKGTWQI